MLRGKERSIKILFSLVLRQIAVQHVFPVGPTCIVSFDCSMPARQFYASLCCIVIMPFFGVASQLALSRGPNVSSA